MGVVGVGVDVEVVGVWEAGRGRGSRRGEVGGGGDLVGEEVCYGRCGGGGGDCGVGDVAVVLVGAGFGEVAGESEER